MDVKQHFNQHTQFIVQELCESRGGRPGLSVLTSLIVSVDHYIEPCFGIGLSLSLICQLTSEDIKQHYLPTMHGRGMTPHCKTQVQTEGDFSQ